MPIKSLKQAALTGAIIHVPDSLALPDDLMAELQRWLKIRVTDTNTKKPARLLSSLLAKIGLDRAKDPQRTRNADGTRTRFHRIDRESFDLQWGDGEGYFAQTFEDKPQVTGWVLPHRMSWSVP